MSTLTKEWLQQTIAELEEERDATPGAVNEDVAMALAAMKLALASLEAEAVALRDERSGSGGISKKPGFNDLPHGTPLYAAPPAPVALPVQHWEELCRQNPDMSIGDAIIRAAWWNHCAAMLQGGEQTNYRAIVERIAEIIHGKVTDIDLLTVTVKSMKDKLQK